MSELEESGGEEDVALAHFLPFSLSYPKLGSSSNYCHLTRVSFSLHQRPPAHKSGDGQGGAVVPQLPGHGADQRPEAPAAGPAAAAPAGQAPVLAGNAAVARVAEAAWLRSAVEDPLPSPSIKADAADLQLAVAAVGPPPAMAAAVLDLAPVVNREGEVSGE